MATIKLSAIETFLAFYPDLPFILIGDSGQEDATIYKTVVERHPGRIQAVYIRTLREAPERDEPAGDLLRDIEAMGVQTVLAPDLLPAATTAAERGWIKGGGRRGRSTCYPEPLRPKAAITTRRTSKPADHPFNPLVGLRRMTG